MVTVFVFDNISYFTTKFGQLVTLISIYVHILCSSNRRSANIFCHCHVKTYCYAYFCHDALAADGASPCFSKMYTFIGQNEKTGLLMVCAVLYCLELKCHLIGYQISRSINFIAMKPFLTNADKLLLLLCMPLII